MGPDMRNEAARFVTLIDALYEHKVKLLAAADAEPAGLYPAGDGSFEFQRTVSRLEEMRSAEYLAEGHGAPLDRSRGLPSVTANIEDPLMRRCSLFLLACFSAPLLAQANPVTQPSKLDPKWQARTRALLEQAIEIPTVVKRGQVPQMAQLIAAELRKARLPGGGHQDHAARGHSRATRR